MSTWVASGRQADFAKDFGVVGDPNDNKTNPKVMDKSHMEDSTDGPGFIIYARELTILHSDKKENWVWKWDRIGPIWVEVAEMVAEKELDARGSFETKKLKCGKRTKSRFC
ncbi:protein PHLOEM PROTEIN 2-LIKE A8-like [Syzygium oleosum]|uniref:protein PHLOEM PROTEIN 2-LIKE A8-like n=1 Tax=Syzygium oleosum TaxID=219896 RepID=UPI0024B9FC80|nr:protein PHLOEM PROTEIN 2-LIKE A8-like [Syzygium oleosum]